MKHHTSKSFSMRIIFPTLLTIILFVTSMFLIIIPLLKGELMEDKKEMIHELTNSAWSILEEQYAKEKEGLLTRPEAQKNALQVIQNLRYGKELKDYFWIIDTTPVMVMHPYRDDLIGINLLEYTDKNEKKLFREMVEIAQKHGDGFVDYHWQWKDDQTKIVPKVSYVKSFTPWSWIIGTGIYLNDVEEEISAINSTLFMISSAITLLIVVLLFKINLESLKIERKREQAEKDLEKSERLAVLGQMVAEIIHEIKNPLMVIGGFARRLRKREKDKESAKKLDIIANEVSRLENLLRGLKYTFTPQTLILQKINLCQVLQEVQELLTDECKEMGIALDLHLIDTCMLIDADRDKLKQVIINLLKNSMEAMKDGGKLSITTRYVDDTAEIAIHDSGPGIPQKIKEKIFDPFFTTKKDGTGLGLCISKKIVESHKGGSFNIESKEGLGTVVRLALTRAHT